MFYCNTVRSSPDAQHPETAGKLEQIHLFEILEANLNGDWICGQRQAIPSPPTPGSLQWCGSMGLGTAGLYWLPGDENLETFKKHTGWYTYLLCTFTDTEVMQSFSHLSTALSSCPVPIGHCFRQPQQKNIQFSPFIQISFATLTSPQIPKFK